MPADVPLIGPGPLRTAPEGVHLCAALFESVTARGSELQLPTGLLRSGALYIPVTFLLPWRDMNTRRGRVPAERLHMTPSVILPGDPDCNDFSNGTVVGRDGAVGIATDCGLKRPAIEFRWGRDFPHPSRRTLGPTQPPIYICTTGTG